MKARASTADLVAAVRALHQRDPVRLIDDPYAIVLCGRYVRRILRIRPAGTDHRALSVRLAAVHARGADPGTLRRGGAGGGGRRRGYAIRHHRRRAGLVRPPPARSHDPAPGLRDRQGRHAGGQAGSAAARRRGAAARTALRARGPRSDPGDEGAVTLRVRPFEKAFLSLLGVIYYLPRRSSSRPRARLRRAWPPARTSWSTTCSTPGRRGPSTGRRGSASRHTSPRGESRCMVISVWRG